MQHRSHILALGLALVAAFVTGSFFAWLFSLEGSKGLGQWGWNGIYLGIATLGALPLVLGLLSLLFKAEKSKAGTGLAWTCTGLSILVVAGILILFGSIYIKAHQVAGPVPALNLVDPATGIAPAGTGPEGQVLHLALSSDPHWGADNAAGTERTAILRSVAAARPDSTLR